MRVLVFPFATTNLDEVIDWFEQRGATEIRLWRGPDGSVRGTGVLR